MTRQIGRRFCSFTSFSLPSLQIRLLLAILEVVELAVRVVNEDKDRLQSAAAVFSSSRDNDGLAPEAFLFRALYPAKSLSARSASLFTKAMSSLLQWRLEALFPRLDGMGTRGR